MQIYARFLQRFTLVQNVEVCQRMGISIAAVDEELHEVYINPLARLNEGECRFVMAHELLHVGLRHARRRQGRDHFLWNVACDFVINQWLVEMGIGTMPQRGLLYDPELKGMSAEAIYDRLTKDLRRARKLMTFRGVGVGDIIDKRSPEWWNTAEGMTLDQFYREVLTNGLDYMSEHARGYLPAGLLEEIRALAQRPIRWDVALGEWFDRFFAPLERHRSYARPSRRQASTPDIPRPRYVLLPEQRSQRTFGVVLDTSGSMDRHILAKALGTIASYALARDVAAVRLVFCDAEAYDEGYVAPELIGDRVRVKGRGGTILQPGIDLLEHADDFPTTAPILIITDGLCDDFRVRREHAIVVLQGRRLPVAPRGPVFQIPMGD